MIRKCLCDSKKKEIGGLFVYEYFKCKTPMLLNKPYGIHYQRWVME